MATSHLPPSDKCATHRHIIVAPLTSPPLLEGLRNCEHWKCCQGYKGVNNSACNKSCLDMLGHLFTWVCCSSSSKLCRFCSAPAGKEAIPGLCQNHHVPRRANVTENQAARFWSSCQKFRSEILGAKMSKGLKSKTFTVKSQLCKLCSVSKKSGSVCLSVLRVLSRNRLSFRKPFG